MALSGCDKGMRDGRRHRERGNHSKERAMARAIIAASKSRA